MQTVPALSLSVRGLTVSYGRRQALRAVSIDAPAGQVTGVIGPNGAGKSTLLKAVLGLVRPDCGTITAGGHALGTVRRSIAYLPQRSAVDWDYPAQVREVVTMGRYPHLRWHRRMTPLDRERVTEALARVGLQALSQRQIGELSGGQQQRVFLARAIAQEARMLLLDEPFVGIDAPTIALLCDVLRELAASGACVVVVNHDLSIVGSLCDRLVLLNQEIIAQGATAEVLTPTQLAAAYGGYPAFSLRVVG